MAGKLLDETGLAELWSCIGDKYDGLYQHCWKKIAYSGVKQETQISSAGVIISSTGNAQTIYYSKSVRLVSGEAVLVDPQSITITNANPSSLAALAPVYISNLYEDPTGVYYLPQGTTGGTNEGYTVSVISTTKNVILRPDSPVIAKKVTYTSVSATTELVFSTNRNQYPDSGLVGDYEYQYVGIPFENAACASRIATGSYTGTFKYGVDNPNSLTFDFVPKLLFVVEAMTPGTQLIFVRPDTFSEYTETQSGRYSGNVSAIYVKCSGTTVSWYSQSNYSPQCNQGHTYYYLAIG